MSSAALFAVQYIRKMTGKTQAHLMRASDGNLYVTKFQNTPGGVRTLASEFLATKLALSLGLPMAGVQVIEVPTSLVADTPELRIEVDGTVLPCKAGLQLGSRYAADPVKDRVFDHMPESQFHRIGNRMDLVRMLAFDKWTGNCDGRQAVFVKRDGTSGYHMIFIDQHYCFDGHWWSFPDLPIHGTYRPLHVYEDVTGWEAFEPTLSRIEAIDYTDLWRCAAQIPHEWIEYDGEGLFTLLETLHYRRAMVRGLITELRNSSCNPFPNWRDHASTGNSVPECFAVP